MKRVEGGRASEKGNQLKVPLGMWKPWNLGLGRLHFAISVGVDRRLANRDTFLCGTVGDRNHKGWRVE